MKRCLNTLMNAASASLFMSPHMSPTARQVGVRFVTEWCRKLRRWGTMPPSSSLGARGERDVEGGDGLALRSDADRATRPVDRVDDGDDVLELGPVVGVEDRLVEGVVAIVRVLALRPPLARDLRGEFVVAHDVGRPRVEDGCRA